MSLMSDRRSLLTGFAAAAFAATMEPALGAVAQPFFRRIGGLPGLQLYILGDAPKKDLDGTLRRVAEIGYREIELPELYGKKPAEIRAAADRAGLRITSVHLDSFGTPDVLTFDSPAQRVADDLGTLGAHQAVLPVPPFYATGGEARPGEEWLASALRLFTAGGQDFWKRTAHLLNERAAALKPHGISLGYHNHNVEFRDLGNGTGWDILVGETDPGLVTFEVDVGWIAAAGRDPVTILRSLNGRVRQLHVKDIKASTKANTTFEMDAADVGKGKLDWARILPAAYAAGARNFYVEQEGIVLGTGMAVGERAFGYLTRLKV